jgi:hypothetical protein
MRQQGLTGFQETAAKRRIFGTFSLNFHLNENFLQASPIAGRKK